jgi:hypothetical protein
MVVDQTCAMGRLMKKCYTFIMLSIGTIEFIYLLKS